MLKLRPYQEEAVAAIQAAIVAGVQRFLLVSPTGSGKTVVASELIRRTVAAGSQVLFLAHRRELIDQTSAKLDLFGVPHGVIMANHHRWLPFEPVQVASVQTLVRRLGNMPPVLQRFRPVLIVVDEAHRALAPTYRECYAHWEHARILGLTATPWTNTGKGLGDYFQAGKLAATVQQLVDDGSLVPCDGFGYEQPDLTGVRIVAGDYNEGELDRRVNMPPVIGGYVDRWLQFSPNKRTIAFAVSVSHSQHIAEAFRARGVTAEHLDGQVPAEARAAILRRLRSGETMVVSNCAVLCEGFDEPGVEVCIMARPTRSLSLYIQCVGRALRPHCFDCNQPTRWQDAACNGCGSTRGPKRIGRLHDHSGCLLQHGTPEEPRDYSLAADLRRQGKSTGPSVMFCPECFRPMSSGSSKCSKCGWVKPAVLTEEVAEVEERKVLSLDEVRALRGAPRGQQANEYKRMVEECRKTGKGGAMLQFKELFGSWPYFSKSEIAGADEAKAKLGMRVVIGGKP